MKVWEVLKMLEQDGWYLDRTRGSHRQLKHPTKLGWSRCLANPTMVWGQALSIVF
jgi:hypothetical protein